ncbi:MAG: MFS transporter [Candidatus Eremiobacteraeota bacterium]|nr:MFS transporter [Candidatus Eremiobacteraeota bacterium]
MLMVVLDSTVVMVALRSIQRALGFSAANLAWPINAYLIAFGGTLLLAGRLGDLVGAKRVFGTGLIVFTAASLLCGVANSQWMLIAARFVQGLGGAMASAVILAMIYTAFTEAHERAKALSVFSFTASAGGSVGLLVGGAIAQTLNWHWIFLVNVPIGVVTYVLARRIVPNSPGIGLREGADALGAALLTSALMLAIYTVVEIPQSHASWPTITAAVVSVGLMAAFIVRQARVAKPLLPLRTFKNPIVVGSNVLQIVVVSGLYAFFFLYSLYVRSVLHYDPIETGLAFLPLTLAIGAFSVGPSAWLMRRFGSRIPLVAGLAVAGVGLATFALAPASAPYATIVLPAMTLVGIGLGVAFPCIMEFAMSSATPSDSGLISGLVNTTAEVGGAFGLAVIASIAASLANGYHVAFAICTILVIAGAALAATTFRTARSSSSIAPSELESRSA